MTGISISWTSLLIFEFKARKLGHSGSRNHSVERLSSHAAPCQLSLVSMRASPCGLCTLLQLVVTLTPGYQTWQTCCTQLLAVRTAALHHILLPLSSNSPCSFAKDICSSSDRHNSSRRRLFSALSLKSHQTRISHVSSLNPPTTLVTSRSTHEIKRLQDDAEILMTRILHAKTGP
jgi:hypothetical protein